MFYTLNSFDVFIVPKRHFNHSSIFPFHLIQTKNYTISYLFITNSQCDKRALVIWLTKPTPHFESSKIKPSATRSASDQNFMHDWCRKQERERERKSANSQFETANICKGHKLPKFCWTTWGWMLVWLMGEHTALSFSLLSLSIYRRLVITIFISSTLWLLWLPSLYTWEFIFFVLESYHHIYSRRK